MDDLLESIAEAIRVSPEPWKILETIKDNDRILSNDLVRSVIEERIEFIAESIRTHSEPWQIIDGIGSIELVTADDRIRDAIAEAIRLVYNPSRILSSIRQIPGIFEDKRITEALRVRGLKSPDR